ncbi:unnamed protein product, partial [Amoebophrya sp. A120]
VEIYPEDVSDGENADIKVKLKDELNAALLDALPDIKKECSCIMEASVAEVGQLNLIREKQRVIKIGVRTLENVPVNKGIQELLLDDALAEYRKSKAKAAATMSQISKEFVQLVDIGEDETYEEPAAALLQLGANFLQDEHLRGPAGNIWTTPNGNNANFDEFSGLVDFKTVPTSALDASFPTLPTLLEEEEQGFSLANSNEANPYSSYARGGVTTSFPSSSSLSVLPEQPPFSFLQQQSLSQASTSSAYRAPTNPKMIKTMFH